MRKFLSLLIACVLCLCCCGAAFGEADDPVLAAWRDYVDAELRSMTEKADGWTGYILSHATIVRVGYTGKNDAYVEAVIGLPNVAADKKAENLADAMRPYVACDDLTEAVLSASYAGEAGHYVFTWSAKKPAGVLSVAKGIASRGKKGYTTKAFQALLTDVFVPHMVSMPKRAPKTVPALGELPAGYAASAAAALNITEAQANLRLPPLLMLCEVNKVDATEVLTHTVVTLRVKGWDAVLTQAKNRTVTELDTTVNAPGLTRTQMEEMYCRHLAECWMDAYYATGKSSYTQRTVTIDLPALVTRGAGASGGLTELLQPAMTTMDAHLDELMTYAAGKAYYPDIPLVDTGFLTGEDDPDGDRVQFECDGQCGYVVMQRGGSVLFRAFIHPGARLNIRLKPGDYTVTYGTGPRWYGERYLFGDEGNYGRFELSLTGAPQTRIHLTTSGSTEVQRLTGDEVLNIR